MDLLSNSLFVSLTLVQPSRPPARLIVTVFIAVVVDSLLPVALLALSLSHRTFLTLTHVSAMGLIDSNKLLIRLMPVISTQKSSSHECEDQAGGELGVGVGLDDA